MLLHNLFSNLSIIHHNKEESDYAHVPNYTPTILTKIEGDHQHHHHHHVYHLHRSESHALSVCSSCCPQNEDNSIFVAEPGTERRGVFRTNEPIWVCTVNAAPQHKSDANGNGLIILDDQSQKTLETVYKKKKLTCQLAEDSTTGLCNVNLVYGDADASTTTIDSTADSTASKDPSLKSIRQLNYDIDIKRMTTPVWWFEKKGLGPRKEFGRFDWRNQIRLEAYDDDNATLALTDGSFAEPFTVALSQAKHKDEQEWQGFMYLNTVPRQSNGNDEYDESDDEYYDLNIQGRDNFPNFNTFKDKQDQEELRQEETYRKAHINKQV
ncbi:Anaphase-promoting complex subunit 1 [Mucor velutinosus]|uniref:Anaphase-promoting complex subunit 1 n=1 Tax=Mucor velutinosus TaxID=708070 RepID=A0AAN7DR15_9FUNG|nr:Anaphase-promoting complex subunit 1 [Mucor velutinosus]